MHVSSMYLKYVLQNKFLNLFPVSLSSYTSKLKAFMKMLNSYKIITSFGFWVLQNSDPIIHSSNNINEKSVQHDISTLCTKLLHYKLKSKLSFIVDFVFKGGVKTIIRLSKSVAAYWGKKAKGGLGFSKSSLKTAINHLIENCYFNVGNVSMKQAVGIPIGIDSAQFCANLFFIFL